MAIEHLLPVQLEITLGIIDNDLVVHTLTCKVFSVRMHGRCGNCVHVGLRNVLGDNRDAKLPYIDFLVISRAHKPPPMLDKSQRIYRSEMLLVLLNNVFRVGVKLQDFLVGAPSQENVLLILCGMEFDTEGCFPIGKTADNFTCFGVP